MVQNSSGRYDLFAMALSDYHHRRRDCPPLFLIREDGYRDVLPAAFFFSVYEEFPPLEKKVIDAVDGSTLDIGAGAGRHSLVLQERGLDVTSLEIEPLLVDVMCQRGLKKVVQSDIYSFEPGMKYKYILLLANGLGIAGDLTGLHGLLNRLVRMLDWDGKIYANSVDVAVTKEKLHLAYLERIRKKGRYKGEIQMFLEYGGRTGPMIKWLHVDFDTLSDIAERAGFRSTLLDRSPYGEYMVEMSYTKNKSG